MVHDLCHEEMAEVLAKGNALVESIAGRRVSGAGVESAENAWVAGTGAETVTLVNTLGFDRTDDVVLPAFPGLVPADPSLRAQRFRTWSGEEKTAVGGLVLPSFSGTAVTWVAESESMASAAESAFRFDGKVLETPFASVTFGEDGTIASFVDRRNGRELRGAGLPLNTFLMAEDLPSSLGQLGHRCGPPVQV